MNQRVMESVEEIFKTMPKTKKIQNLKEELMGNLETKYNDLIKNGKDEEEAYKIVIESISGMDEVIEIIQEYHSGHLEKSERLEYEKKRTARVVCGAMALSIVAVIAYEVVDEWGGSNSDILAKVVFLFIIGGAACLLAYHCINK